MNLRVEDSVLIVALLSLVTVTQAVTPPPTPVAPDVSCGDVMDECQTAFSQSQRTRADVRALQQCVNDVDCGDDADGEAKKEKLSLYIKLSVLHYSRSDEYGHNTAPTLYGPCAEVVATLSLLLYTILAM
ncbi:uncharacterized protein LOC131950533 [Physella acuta]|uniref:uncharacterized protein LOC131950533 n=1 Tax=Physella acuta TaxID=109671 RepID=UPI0027DCC9D3|nr:uncharacterized protein LOC131950533 [Physella acuta]